MSAVGLKSTGARWLLLLFLSQDQEKTLHLRGRKDFRKSSSLVLLPEGVPLPNLALEVLIVSGCKGSGSHGGVF